MRKLFGTAAVCTLSAVALLVAPGAAASEIEYAKHKGLRYASDDGQFKISLGGRIQVRFVHDDPATGDSTGSFDIRRARLSLGGTIWENWKFKFQTEFEGGSAATKDAYFQYAKHEHAQFWVGQGKVPFGRQQLNSSGKLQFVDRAIATGEFVPERSQGVALVGSADAFDYQLGVYDDFEAPNVRENSDDNYMVAGRVVWNPLGAYKLAESSLDYPEDARLSIGLKALTDTVDLGAGVEVDNMTSGVELAYKLRGFNAVAEYFDRTLETTGLPDADSDGGYLQLGWLFPNKTSEIAGRYSVISPDTVGASADRTETGIAYSHYFHAHDYKLQFDYRQLEFDAAPTLDTDELRAQLQFVF